MTVKDVRKANFFMSLSMPTHTMNNLLITFFLQRKPSIERLLASTLINDDQMTEMTFHVSYSIVIIIGMKAFFFLILQKIPPINELSQHLQAMWTICAKMHQADYGSEHIKRFDVNNFFIFLIFKNLHSLQIDGSYDLQILSYT